MEKNMLFKRGEENLCEQDCLANGYFFLVHTNVTLLYSQLFSFSSNSVFLDKHFFMQALIFVPALMKFVTSTDLDKEQNDSKTETLNILNISGISLIFQYENISNKYRVLVGKLEGKRLLGRPRRRWEDNIQMDFFRKWDLGVWTGSSWIMIGTGGGHL